MTSFRVAIFLLGVLRTTRVAGEYEARRGALDIARCEVQCWSRNGEQCLEKCLRKEEPRPGSCPAATPSGFCDEKCRTDSQCRGTLKCCQHTCGMTCQRPVDLDMASGVPAIPSAPTVIEKRKKNSITLDWSENHQKHTLYVIEQRHLAGTLFDEKRAGKWSTCCRSTKPRKTLKRYLKPNRWYQFRVAAVGEGGTRGYSDASLPYRVFSSAAPPDVPRNVTVGPLAGANGTAGTTVAWAPPVSQLPIDKYRVFWSKRIEDCVALDAVVIRRKEVPQDQTRLRIDNLQTNSLYFLQVQALVETGNEKLKGEKFGLVLNTTNYSNDENSVVSDTGENLLEIQLFELVWEKRKLKARVHLKQVDKKSNIYRVRWWESPHHPRKSKKKSVKKTSTIKGAHFDISKLRFDCQYRISIKHISKGRRRSDIDTLITFTTPKCSDFQKSYKTLKCNSSV